MPFYKRVIASISSILFIVSNCYAITAPLFNEEEKVRELDPSCSCSFSDLIGSDFSCSFGTETIEILNFGEVESVCTIYRDDGSVRDTWPFALVSSSFARYSYVEFPLDPTETTVGECVNNWAGSYVFGCWACPPTAAPTLFPTDSPSTQPSGSPNPTDVATESPSTQPSDSVNQVDDVGNNDSDNPTDDDENSGSDENGGSDNTNDSENGEECCCCSCSLFSSLQKLFLIEN